MVKLLSNSIHKYLSIKQYNCLYAGYQAGGLL